MTSIGESRKMETNYIDEIKEIGVNEVWVRLIYEGVEFTGCLTEKEEVTEE